MFFGFISLIFSMIIFNMIANINSDNERINERINYLKNEIRLLKKEITNISQHNELPNEVKQIETKSDNEIIINKNTAINCESLKPKISEVEQKIIKSNFEENLHNNNAKINQAQTYNDNKNQKTKSSFEELFMGNVFNKIGAIAILIAMILFVNLISQYITFTNGFKISIAYIIGIILMIKSLMNKEEKTKVFSEVLLGTGIGTLFITTYFAVNILSYFTIPIATTISIMLLLFTYYIANKQKTLSMLVIGLIGGYLNPFFVNSSINNNFLFNYLIFLNIISLIFVYRNRSKSLVNSINLLFTTFIVIVFSFISNDFYALHHCLILWLIYVIYDILTINREVNIAKQFTSKLQTYINFISLTILTMIFFRQNYAATGLLLMIAVVLYFILGLYNTDKFEKCENSYYHSAIMLLFPSTYFLTITNYQNMIMLYALEALFITLFSIKTNQAKIMYYTVIYASVVYIKIFTTEEMFDLINYPANSLIFVITGILFYINALLFEKYNFKGYSNIFKICGITLFYILIVNFINCCISNDYIQQNYFLYICAIILAIYSYNLKLIYKNESLVNYASNLFNITSAIILILAEICMTLKETIPFLNIRLLSYAIVCIFIYFSNKNNKNLFYKYLLVILGFAYIHYESINIISNFDILNRWLTTFMWTIYAGTISMIGIFNEKDYLKKVGIWISIFIVLRLLIIDLAGLDMIFKLLIFMVLGIVLMTISYYYNKKM